MKPGKVITICKYDDKGKLVLMTHVKPISKNSGWIINGRP